MITFEYRYDIIPERREEFLKWAREQAMPIWVKMPEVKGFRVYDEILLGSPHRIVQIDVEDLGTLGRLLANPEVRQIVERLRAFTTNLSESFLTLVFSK
ncbi:MAG: hypothetical protein HY347_02075 [candidate division NC10 bacterium]|nr:hypothetical protein [candidate division NC10 bacterium]